MFPVAVHAVRETHPKAVLFENVKGLTRESFSNYFEYIKFQIMYPELSRLPNEDWTDHRNRLERQHLSGRRTGLCYRVVSRVLNAADFGVPQRRERVFIVGFRSDLNLEWSVPDQTHSRDALLWDQYVSGEYWERHRIPKASRPIVPSKFAARVSQLKAEDSLQPTLFGQRTRAWRTVRDAISDLPDPEQPHQTEFFNHTYQPGARAYAGHTGSPLDEPAKTLKAGDHGVPGGENMLARPDGSVRYFTVRESARLQTFPDDYVFHGTWTESMRQLGNAVPVDLGAVLAADIRTLLSRASKATAS
jgi:DNA (cytosine-5)-methyltransferase 1